MSKCAACGNPITFIRREGMKPVPVESKPTYYVPDEAMGDTVFVTEKGRIRKGRRAGDGIKGYRLHKCALSAAGKRKAVPGGTGNGA